MHFKRGWAICFNMIEIDNLAPEKGGWEVGNLFVIRICYWIYRTEFAKNCFYLTVNIIHREKKIEGLNSLSIWPITAATLADRSSKVNVQLCWPTGKFSSHWVNPLAFPAQCYLFWLAAALLDPRKSSFSQLFGKAVSLFLMGLSYHLC